MPIILLPESELNSASGLGNPDAILSASMDGGAAISRYARVRSSMLEAMGPWTPTLGASDGVGAAEMRPWDVLRPYTPQYEDGIRIEPPPSAPRAIGTRPVERA